MTTHPDDPIPYRLEPDGNWKPMYESSKKELFTALSKAQGEVENAKKLNANPHFKSKYADLATVWDAIRDPLTSNGLSVIQLPCEAPADHVGLVTILGHSSGQQIEYRYQLKLKDPSNPQAAGSALTYMKRYALMGVAGIAPEDDDGNAATAKPAAPRAATSAPKEDYLATCKEAMLKANTLTLAQARSFYGEVYRSGIPDDIKFPLLKEMQKVITDRKVAEETAATGVTKAGKKPPSKGK